MKAPRVASSRLRVLWAVLALAELTWIIVAQVRGANGHKHVDCHDFTSEDDAQADHDYELDEDDADINRLDEDGDGRVCEAAFG